MAYVYILQSLKNGRYYIGSTDDMRQRYLSHRTGNVKATKNLLPLKILLQQRYPSIEVAREVERKIKRLKRRDYLEKMIKDGVIRIEGE